MSNNSFRAQSRSEWQPTDTQASTEQLQVGCLQRIADATEKMASNYHLLQNEREQYKRWYEMEKQSRQYMERRIAALQGVITKLKKKAK